MQLVCVFVGPYPIGKPLYRWATFDTYDQNYWWLDSGTSFGGVSAQSWTDGNAHAASMSVDSSVLRELFVRNGPILYTEDLTQNPVSQALNIFSSSYVQVFLLLVQFAAICLPSAFYLFSTHLQMAKSRLCCFGFGTRYLTQQHGHLHTTLQRIRAGARQHRLLPMGRRCTPIKMGRGLRIPSL